jgi:hypothetical protein
MSDGGRERALLGVEGWKSSQEWSVQRSAVRSIAWLGLSWAPVVKVKCSAGFNGKLDEVIWVSASNLM